MMVLLVIDVQKEIMNEQLYQFEVFISNLKFLISEARTNAVEVIYVRHDDGVGTPLTKGSAGYEIHEAVSPLKGEMVFDKEVNSVFKDTGLLKYLKKKGIKQVVVTGLQTDYCIDASVTCAFEHGFDVIVPAYTNTTTDNNFMSGKQSYHYYNDFMWNHRYASCISIEATIAKMKQMHKAKLRDYKDGECIV